MVKYCIDTSVFVALLRGDPEVMKKFSSLQEHSVYVAANVLAELYKGAFVMNDKEVERVDTISSNATFLLVEASTCKAFGNNLAKLKAAGKPTQDADLIIGTQAQIHNCILVTRNKKHFEHIPNLTVEVW